MADPTPIDAPQMVRSYFAKCLVEKDEGAVPLVFDMAVLNRYREAGYRLIRTRSAGRVQSPEGWRLDFGVTDEAGVIHAAVRDVWKLPRGEREHLAQYVVAPGLSARYLNMQLGMGGCIDEGDIEDWDGRPKIPGLS